MGSGAASAGHLQSAPQGILPSTRAAEAFDHRAALQWVSAQQQPDGGFPGGSGPSDPESTINAVLAIYAQGLRTPPSRVLAKARDYLLVHGAAYAAQRAGQAARLDLAALAFCEIPDDSGGSYYGPGERNPFANLRLMRNYAEEVKNAPGAARPIMTSGDVRGQAFVFLAIAANYREIPEDALEPLRTAQCPNGGWAADGFRDDMAADAITTALVIQALEALGMRDAWTDGAMEFLRSLRVPGGGFSLMLSDPLTIDPTATAAGIQGLVAVGEDPNSAAWGSPVLALTAFQSSSGRFLRDPKDTTPDLAVTLQAIPAMLERALPIAYLCVEE